MARKKQAAPQRDAKTIPQKIARKQLIATPFNPQSYVGQLQAKSKLRKELIKGTQTDEDSSARAPKPSAPFLARNIRQAAGAVMSGKTSDLSQIKKALSEAEQASKDLTRAQLAEILKSIDLEKRKISAIIKENIKDPQLIDMSFGVQRKDPKSKSKKQRTTLLNMKAIPKLKGIVPQALLDTYKDMEARRRVIDRQFKKADVVSKAAKSGADTSRFNVGDNITLSWYGKDRKGKIVDAKVVGNKVAVELEGLGNRMVLQDRIKITKKFFGGGGSD